MQLPYWPTKQFRESAVHHDRNITAGVTAEDVIASIEMILGWTPDQALVDYHLGLGFANRQELGRYMLATDEFRNKHRELFSAPIFLGDRVLMHTRAGDRIFLVPDDVDLTPGLIMGDRYEVHVEEAIRRVVRPGDVAIDVGSNIGYHTLTIARAVGDGGRVYAFEANPNVYRLLQATLMTNRLTNFRGEGRVKPHHMAVMDRAGSITLSYAPSQYGSGNIVTEDPASDFGSDYSNRVQVPAVALDQLLDELPAVDFIHIDIEGAEPLALRGAQELMRRSPNLKIITEWSTHMMGFMANVADHIAWLMREGFSFHRIEGDGSFLSLRPEQLASLEHCDLLLTRCN